MFGGAASSLVVVSKSKQSGRKYLMWDSRHAEPDANAFRLMVSTLSQEGQNA
jgi:hypothetical protein